MNIHTQPLSITQSPTHSHSIAHSSISPFTYTHSLTRWSNKRPVPELGSESTPYEKVEKFYNFWFKFQSWRDFSFLDEHNLDDAEGRDEKRWMQRQNASKRTKARKQENLRILRLVETAQKFDPRVREHNLKVCVCSMNTCACTCVCEHVCVCVCVCVVVCTIIVSLPAAVHPAQHCSHFLVSFLVLSFSRSYALPPSLQCVLFRGTCVLTPSDLVYTLRLPPHPRPGHTHALCVVLLLTVPPRPDASGA
jgi:Zuotin-like, zuotin homology domain